MRGIFIILFFRSIVTMSENPSIKKFTVSSLRRLCLMEYLELLEAETKRDFRAHFFNNAPNFYGNGIKPIPFPSRKSHFQLWFKASCSAYIQLTMIDSPILKKITSNILPTLKQHLEAQLPPPAGNYIRSEMLDIIFSGKYPTSR